MDAIDTIELLKKNNLLRIVEDEVDIDLEIPHIAYVEVKKEDSKAILFKNPVSKKLGKKFDAPVLMNVFGSFKALDLILGRDSDTIAAQIEELLHLKPPSGLMDKLSMFGKLFNLKSVFPKQLSGRGECQSIVKMGDQIDLGDLPILTTWEEDGGAFITMGQVYTTSIDGTKHNLGMYRLQVYGKNRLGMHWQIHKDGAHFFWEYKKAGKKMPVSVGIGGDPLYIWCGQAPLPNGVFELMLYGFIRGENARLVKSLTNPIYVPADVDYVIEGWVDPNEVEIEGPFGDHTGYYTLREPYPVMEVSAITSKLSPIYNATVVGKPPLEDKYMGYGTERVFLPLLKTTAPDLLDYAMPENGVFHNLILAKMRTLYPGHAKQFMHAFWGVGQMSFVKHAIFVGEDAPKLRSYDEISDHILDRLDAKNILISEGVCDALDHSSPSACYGGKLGIDATGEVSKIEAKTILSDAELLEKARALEPQIMSLKQYKTNTKTPLTVIGVDKKTSMREAFARLKPLEMYTRAVVFVDEAKNSVQNPYMLVWRVCNNIDAQRDIYIDGEFFGIDATDKNALDGYEREWPKDTDCTKRVLEDLRKRGLLDVDDEFLKKFYV